jgi:hypothetical protein
VIVRSLLLAAIGALLAYAAAGAVVAYKVRHLSLADDPEHDLDAHALLSIVMCWPHDVQSLRD